MTRRCVEHATVTLQVVGTETGHLKAAAYHVQCRTLLTTLELVLGAMTTLGLYLTGNARWTVQHSLPIPSA